ncbi:MAG: hypothetical protein RLZZ621_1691 [Gemmatimonadota bacterium]
MEDGSRKRYRKSVPEICSRVSSMNSRFPPVTTPFPSTADANETVPALPVTTRLPQLPFDNRFVRELPGDAEPRNFRRQVRDAAWSAVMPTPVRAPRLVAWAEEVGALVGFSAADASDPEFAAVFGGNALIPGMSPYAACYGGHQFGNWAGQLGDGRAITLGEVVNPHGARWELQLKGAGPTPYSRTADGRAVLRSSIREFLCSEAMHHLGVPTTRALSLVATGDPVMRDMFYDGHPEMEPGAIVCRVAPSFIRFGTFELFASRGDTAMLARLVDFTIARDFPQIEGTPEQRRAAFFLDVCERTARLLVHWMRVGFVHGVMNTDNMSILGLTIDYGPYGWLEDFDPDWTPNTTDAGGRRYAFGQQPDIAHWNLVRLAKALAPLFATVEPLQQGVDRFAELFTAEYARMNAAKFGLSESGTRSDEIVRDGLQLLYDSTADYTRFFRTLGSLPAVRPDTAAVSLFSDGFYDAARRDAQAEALDAWLTRWYEQQAASGRSAEERRAAMDAVNPWFVLRNYLAQEAIDAATAGDSSRIERLLHVLRTPYVEQPDAIDLVQRRPEWARHKAGCSMLSCSS